MPGSPSSVVVVEMAQISELDYLFVMQGIYEIGYIAKTALPMFAVMVLMVGVLVAFPELATWLPENIRNAPGR